MLAASAGGAVFFGVICLAWGTVTAYGASHPLAHWEPWEAAKRTRMLKVLAPIVLLAGVGAVLFGIFRLGS